MQQTLPAWVHDLKFLRNWGYITGADVNLPHQSVKYNLQGTSLNTI